MKRLIGTLVMMMLAFNLAPAQSTKPDGAEKKAAGKNIQPAAATTVTGNGTPGRLSKWVGTAGTNTSVLGDAAIAEDKFGNVGIGSDQSREQVPLPLVR